MTNNTLDRLKFLVAEELDTNIRFEDIDPDAALLEEGLKLDSLAIVELITLAEENFGIEFGESDLTIDSFASLRILAEVIDQLRQPVAASA